LVAFQSHTRSLGKTKRFATRAGSCDIAVEPKESEDDMLPTVMKLIEKQKALWEIKEHAATPENRPGRVIEGGVGYGPCLLISRECGSGGNVTSRIAGERLGWQVFDKEVVDQVSDLSHARQSLVESVDEKLRTKWEETWHSMLDGGDLSSSQYMRYLHEVVMTLGHRGDVVILGRGAQYLLPRPCALRVRLIAPLEQRAARLAEIKQITQAQARIYVQHTDEDRARFVRKTFHSDISDPRDYDLVVNTGEVTFPQVAEIILSALEHKLGVRVS
jgi:hypothetical protein